MKPEPGAGRQKKTGAALRRGAALGWLFGIGGAVAACGAAGSQIHLDPLRFEVVRGEHGPRVEALDAEGLYEEGSAAWNRGDFQLAAEKYGLVADRFPDSRYAVVATYNTGLGLEKLDRFSDAVARFDAVVARVSGSKDAQDALFRIAACQESLEDWSGMKATGERLIEPHYRDIGTLDRIAALAVRGRGAEGLGLLALAERDYRASLDLYKENIGKPGIEQSPFIALAQFRIGEIYHALFASIQFKLPLDRMARDLEDKSNFFLMAQTAYLRALRLRHPMWTVVAGFRLGLLYEVMYDDMMSAEVPTELSRDEVELYYEELRSQVRPLLDRAVDIYERNLRLGQRHGTADAWIKRTEASLARLRDLMRSDAGRAAELQMRSDSPQP